MRSKKTSGQARQPTSHHKFHFVYWVVRIVRYNLKSWDGSFLFHSTMQPSLIMKYHQNCQASSFTLLASSAFNPKKLAVILNLQFIIILVRKKWKYTECMAHAIIQSYLTAKLLISSSCLCSTNDPCWCW